MAASRLHEISGVLDKTIFQRIQAVDHLGKPFFYELEVVSKDRDISPYDTVGQEITISVKTGDERQQSRYFHGIITDFLNHSPSGGYQLYKVQLRPWLWLLNHSFDCRIFQDLSVTEILDYTRSASRSTTT